MSLLVAGNRHFSASALRATLLRPYIRHHNAKERIPAVQRNRKSHHFSDLCSLSIQFRGKRKKTKERKNSKEKGFSKNETGRRRKIRNPSDGGIYVVENEDTVVPNFSPRGETSAYAGDYERARPLPVDKICSNLGTESRDGAWGISMGSNSGKRKRGPPPKNRDGFNQSAVKCKNEDKEELVNLEKRHGTTVDLSALGNYAEDPYGGELRRITVGLETKEEVLGFLEQLNGEWVNTGKKKVVKACDSWKLMLCTKKKGSNLLLACGRFISSDGQRFATCKEVSTYLHSLLESRSKNQLNSLQSDNRNLGKPLIANESLVGNSDSMDLPVLGTETKQSSKKNGDSADPLRTSAVEKDNKGIPASDMKKRYHNMEKKLAALSDSIWKKNEENDTRHIHD